MRLIDADKLRTELFDAVWMTDNDEHMVEEIVERQPTVDAVPVLHARWIWHFNHPVCVHGNAMYETGFRCSACGHGVSVGLHTSKWADTEEAMVRNLHDDTTKYCPNCWAKMMDGGKQDAAD